MAGQADSVGQINIDVAAMVAAARELNDTEKNIFGRLSTIQHEFDTLARSWTGESAAVYQSAMQGYYDDCNNILGALRNLAEAVDTSAINYEKQHHMSTDEATSLKQQINQLPSKLPGF